MKKNKNLLLGLVIILMASCSGSDFYQGNWKATDLKGEKFDILYEANKFYIKDTTGEQSDFDYTQNYVSIENGVRTYGIKLSDGRNYFIHFPFSNDASKGIIKDANNKILYTIGRNDYITYEDLYELK